MSHPRLGNVHAVVLGGGSGIGRATVLAYLAEGAHVTVVERSAELAANLEAQATSQRLRTVVGDATQLDTVRQAIELAVAAAGPDGLSHLTCCVGAFDHYASLRDMSIDDLVGAAEETWRVNVLSTLMAIRTAWPALRDARGSITLTLSESAFHPVGGGVLYGSSKWALRGMVQHLAADLAPEVRVNGVAPGGTSGTRFAGLDALGQAETTVEQRHGRDQRIAAGTMLATTPTPDDHTGAYVYLADPQAARIVTGVVINTDGGRAMR